MAYTAEYWEYDARLLRRWNTDPIEYEWQSTYACFNNNPIFYADPLGLKGEGGGKGKRTEKKRADGGKTVTDGDMTWEYDKNDKGEGGVYESDRPMGTIYSNGAPPPTQPQDGAEDKSPTGTILGDAMAESNAFYHFGKGDIGQGLLAMFPAARIAYLGTTGTPRIWYNLYQGKVGEAAGIYFEGVVEGGSLMLGMRASGGKAVTESVKKTFTEEVVQLSDELAGAADETASGLISFETASLNITQTLETNAEMRILRALKKSIEEKGIEYVAKFDDQIQVFTSKGVNYIVNGHHRLAVAKKLGIENIKGVIIDAEYLMKRYGITPEQVEKISEQVIKKGNKIRW